MKFLKQLFFQSIFDQQKRSFSKDGGGGAMQDEPIDNAIIDKLDPKLPSATRNHRFSNLVIDTIVFTIITYVFFALIPGFMPEPPKIIKLDADYWRYMIILQSLQILIAMILYVIFEYFFGQTPGKMVTKTKVVDRNGHKPNLGTIVLRTLLRLIPFEAFSFFNVPDKGLHDYLSKTRVVIIK